MKNGAHILIVDDDTDFRLQLRSLLEGDYEVSDLPDGEQAIAQLIRVKPDLIISDVAMEPMDGHELCRQIKSDPNLQLIPVILLTGEAHRESRLSGLDHGANDYVIKPFDPDELLARIRNLLKIRDLQKELLQASYLKSMAQLVAGLSHEMNNPLGFMQGNLDALQEGMDRLMQWMDRVENAVDPSILKRPAEVDQVRADLPSIMTSLQNGSDRITHVVKALREFVQSEDGDESRVPVIQSIQHLLDLSSSQIIDVSVEFDKYLAGNAVWPIALNHSVQHLIFNAAEATRQKGGQGNRLLRIKAIEEENSIVVEISDNGPGIPSELKTRIFAPFFTTKPGHSGIGLTVAYGVASRYGGTITFTSDNAGSAFFLKVPSGL